MVASTAQWMGSNVTLAIKQTISSSSRLLFVVVIAGWKVVLLVHL